MESCVTVLPKNKKGRYKKWRHRHLVHKSNH